MKEPLNTNQLKKGSQDNNFI